MIRTRLLLLLACLGFIFASDSVYFTLAQQDDPLIEVPGTIAFIGSDFNVYSIDGHNRNTAMLTEDGNQLQRRYQWPTWSRQGELAYFCCQGQIGLEILYSPDGITSGTIAYESIGEAFTYAGWSPTACSDTETCYDLAVLISDLSNGRFDVRLINPRAEDNSIFIDSGAPFYFSWSPDRQNLLLFRNEQSIEIFSVQDQSVVDIDVVPGIFPAPQWSPIDDRLLIGVANSETQSTDIAVIANSEIQTVVTDLNGQVLFNWSPDGNYVAYTTISQNSADLLRVVDAVSGEIVAQTNFDDTFAFFWSPNSQHIAYITSSVPQGSFSAKRQQNPGIAWGVLDVETNTNRRYGAFFPTQEMVYMLSFFTQFAQSHSIWSPDSTHIVFTELLENNEPNINILNMMRQNSVPLSIAQGYLAIWSYE